MKAFEAIPLSEQEILARARADNNSSVRALAVARAGEVAQPANPVSAISGYLQGRDFRLRLAALTCLAQRSENRDAGEIHEQLASIVSELADTSPEWQEVAEALGEIRHPAALDLHIRLLRHTHKEVKRQAILSAGKAGQRELVPFLIQMLHESEYASDIRHALQEYGPRIFGTLRDTLMDPEVDVEIRRNIPLVLACIPDQGSVDLLLDALFDYDGLLRYRAVRALGKLRMLDPSLRFDPDKVILRIREESESTLWLEHCISILYGGGGGPDMLAKLLQEKVARGKDRVFRLLALLLPPTTACASFLALVEEDRLRLASAAEYLDNILPGKLKHMILPLMEPNADASREVQGVKSILERLLRNPDPILRECVADAIAKERWAGFLDRSPTLRGRKEREARG